MEKVTVYFNGSMGMGAHKIEGKLINFGTSVYAQYNGSPFIEIIPKRKRKGRRYRQTYNPYMIILMGHGHPDVDDSFEVISSSADVVVKQSKYLSFDSQYEADLDTKLDKYLEESGTVVLADYRYTKGFCAYTGRVDKDLITKE